MDILLELYGMFGHCMGVRWKPFRHPIAIVHTQCHHLLQTVIYFIFTATSSSLALHLRMHSSSVIRHPTTHIRHHASPIARATVSHIVHRTSHLAQHATACITVHTSHFKHRTPHIIRHRAAYAHHTSHTAHQTSPVKHYIE